MPIVCLESFWCIVCWHYVWEAPRTFQGLGLERVRALQRLRYVATDLESLCACTLPWPEWSSVFLEGRKSLPVFSQSEARCIFCREGGKGECARSACRQVAACVEKSFVLAIFLLAVMPWNGLPVWKVRGASYRSLCCGRRCPHEDMWPVPTKGVLSRFYYFCDNCTVWKYTECSLLWCLNQAAYISKDRKVTVSCSSVRVKWRT